MGEPQVDILLATYNGERFVGVQIRSIQAQTYKNWRLLVSDDCSDDGTLDVVRGFAAEDNRIFVVSEGVRYGGAKDNFFALMNCSDAAYCMFCDQDDVWLSEKVEKSLSALRMLEGEYGADMPLLVFCDMKVVDEKLNVIHDSFERSSRFDPNRLSFKQLLAHNVAAGCCMLFNRPLLKICLCSDGKDAMMHDWWVMLAASAFGQISYIDQALSLYRQHGGNEVGANEYSPFERAKNSDFLVSQFLLSTQQALAFGNTYGDVLSQSHLKSLSYFAMSGQATNPFSRVEKLLLSGCWKSGARKLGQIFAAATVSSCNRKRGQ